MRRIEADNSHPEWFGGLLFFGGSMGLSEIIPGCVEEFVRI
jgi:hypothetical protein